MSKLTPGDLLDNRYRIVSTLATGGFGQTYIAEDTRRPGNPKCVVKHLTPASSDPTFLEHARRLFGTEAETLEKLGTHDKIPQLLASFEEKQQFYLVQKLIEGHPLTSELQLGQRWSESQVYQMLQEVLSILQFVHSNGVIHRDIKPDNIIRRNLDNKLVLVDFGTVKLIRTQMVASGQFNPTIAVGTPGYMPTEQHLGNPCLNSDIYALGIIGIQAVTGITQLPKDHNTGEIIWQPWAQINQELASILTKMVRYDFKDRYQSAEDALHALEPLLRGVSPESSASLGVPSGQQPSEPQPTQVSSDPRPVPIGEPQPTAFSGGSSVMPNSQGEQKDRGASRKKISKYFPHIAIAIAVLLLGALLVKLINSQNNTPTTITLTSPPENPASTSVQSRFSFGNKTLVNKEESNTENQEFQAAKKRGVEAIATGNYQQAVIEFEAAIQKYRNAPETLIYLNNARIGTKKAYTIAVAVPIGSDANGALEILRGVAQAQNEVNQAGGINGVPLKVAIANDDDEPKIAQQVASELVKNSEVLGVVGHFSSGATLAAGEEYNSGKLVTISPVSTAVKLSDFSRYVFRSVPNDAIAAKALANYMLTKLNKQKAAVFFNSQSTYSKSLKSKFVEEVFANGGQVEKELEFDLSDPSFSARKSVDKALEKGAQVLMLAANTGTLDKALLVIQSNQKRLNLLGGDDVYAPKILADGGEAAVSMVVAVAWHIDGNSESDFPRRSEQLWQSRVNWRTATSYDAAQALIAALKRDPTRSGVQQALFSSDFSATGARGTIKFLSSGDYYGPIQLVEVRPGKLSGTGYDFVPIR